MYIGDSKLTTMDAFLNGAQFGLSINKINEVPEFRNFHFWVRDKLELEPLSVGFKTTILEHCNGDEEKGLQKFFELIEEFKKTKVDYQ